MKKITQNFTFDATHRLPRVPETHRRHRMCGHSYRVELRRSERALLPICSMLDVEDFGLLCSVSTVTD